MYRNWKKNIILFLLSQTISLFGSSLVQYAIMWHITLKTQSGVMMTIAIICGFLPTFFLSPFAGVWADRYNRKYLIIMADSTIALSTLVLAIIFLNGYKMLWLLFFISAVRALGAAVQMPAVNAFIPQVVPQDKLTQVNAANTSIQSLVMLISPMLSGALLTFASLEIIFFIDVITAVIGVFILCVLNIPAHGKAMEKQNISYFSDMRAGLAYINQHKYIKKLFMFTALFFILSAPVSFLTPLQVARSFGDDVWRLTAIEVAFSIGMILGGGIMAYWGGFKNKIHSMTLSVIALGTSTIALGIIGEFSAYLVIMGLAGIFIPLFNTPFTVLLQERVDTDYLGRIFGVLVMISSTMMPIGMLLFGPMADIIQIEWLLIGTGLLILAEGYLLLGNKILIEAGKPIS
ncbi:MAG: MFS transporter [Syntrophomonas sp.]|nr:MFS transporter [Syntrophomonas sp.]